MATADEILSTMADETTDYTAVCEIDFVSRVISIPPSIIVLGVESDDDVRRINFIMPCTYGECDLNDFEININYLNAKGEPDIYTVDDMAHAENAITFSWLVGRTALAYKGAVKFIVCLKKRSADTGAVLKELNTTVATLEVLEGLEVGDAIVEQNPDALEEILVRLNKSEAVSINLVNGSAEGSLRGKNSQSEYNAGSSSYKMGKNATAFGESSEASGKDAFASGFISRAKGESSHAEGNGTQALGDYSHAEGSTTEASGAGAHAEGIGTIASGDAAHAEGIHAIADIYGSHAEGNGTRAKGFFSHAEGQGTIASRTSSHVQGMYNIEDTGNEYLHIVGNGKSEAERSNAHTIDGDGNAWFAGSVFVGNNGRHDGDKLLTMKEILENVICIVNMTAEADDTMSTFTFLSKDKTFADVKRVFDNGGHVACRVRWTAGASSGMTTEAQLVSYVADATESAFVFAFGANPMIMFKSDDTVSIENA